MFGIDSDVSLTSSTTRVNLFFHKRLDAGPPQVDLHDGFVVLRPVADTGSNSVAMYFDNLEQLRSWATAVLNAAAEPRDRRSPDVSAAPVE